MGKKNGVEIIEEIKDDEDKDYIIQNLRKELKIEKKKNIDMEKKNMSLRQEIARLNEALRN